ncbi:hypothetical protein POM88_053351 [Heracleum sosnowskyi]|uniref:Uncharacterized protein n=1 Tax=Heracleum sosnowskyi TaxID=360622 RepID=A0AAD8LXP6_9APIA|nr:hypothetical protein POM88_053351 [Heracleum sosnowskyi]
MGKTTRWLRGLLGMKKDKDIADNSSLNDKKGKKKWTSIKSGNDSRAANQSPVINRASDSVWLRSSDKEQNKHAIAVAAATAAAADAAVASAQAAAAVVRLTSQGRQNVYGGGRERWAALKIQSVFRGYLIQDYDISNIEESSASGKLIDWHDEEGFPAENPSPEIVDQECQ